MSEVASTHAAIVEHSDDLASPPDTGYLVIEDDFDWAAQCLSRSDLARTFLLGSAKEPALLRHLEEHQMPGGYDAYEWFKVRDLDSVRHPILRIEVADGLGFARIDRFASQHYASYDAGLRWPELLVRYLIAHDRWMSSRPAAPVDT